MIIMSGGFCSIEGTEKEILLDLAKITAGMQTKINRDKIWAAAEMGLHLKEQEDFEMIDLSKAVEEGMKRSQAEDMAKEIMDELFKAGNKE